MLEKDLYAPVKVFFEKEGFTVKSEVKDCDVICEKNGEFLICELKRSLSLDLILQGTARQRLSDFVYLCVPAGKTSRSHRKQRQLYSLLRRLSLGLLLVHGSDQDACVSMAIEAKGAGLKPNTKKKQRTKQEFVNRIGDYNIGGSHQTKIVTYYRECAILLAALLSENGGAMSPKDLVDLGAEKNAGTMLRNNRYGWFLHVSRGLYSLSDEGKTALSGYAEIAEVLIKKLQLLKTDIDKSEGRAEEVK